MLTKSQITTRTKRPLKILGSLIAVELVASLLAWILVMIAFVVTGSLGDPGSFLEAGFGIMIALQTRLLAHAVLSGPFVSTPVVVTAVLSYLGAVAIVLFGLEKVGVSDVVSRFRGSNS